MNSPKQKNSSSIDAVLGDDDYKTHILDPSDLNPKFNPNPTNLLKYLKKSFQRFGLDEWFQDH